MANQTKTAVISGAVACSELNGCYTAPDMEIVNFSNKASVLSSDASGEEAM